MSDNFCIRNTQTFEDVDIFFHSADDNELAFEFYNALREFTWHSLLILELLLAKYISRNSYAAIITGFQNGYDKKNQAEILCIKRWELIQKGWNGS